MKTLNLEQMEKVEGGFKVSHGTLCAGLCLGALGCAIGNIFAPGIAAAAAFTLAGAWLSSCGENSN